MRQLALVLSGLCLGSLTAACGQASPAVCTGDSGGGDLQPAGGDERSPGDSRPAGDPAGGGDPAVAPPSRELFYLPYALHVPVKNPDGSIATGLDGYGNTVNGNSQPLFDTLIGVANPTAVAGDVVLRFFRRDGTPAPWGDGADGGYTLEPGRSVATALIPGNVFPDPPLDFVGFATVETPAGFAVYAMLGGGGFFPEHWNVFSATVPVLRSPLAPRSEWIFPYLIPQFEDLNHAGPQAYRTGITITNFDGVDAWFHLSYTVANVYAAAGTTYHLVHAVPAGTSWGVDLYDELSAVGYPGPGSPNFNSEGWLRVEARSSSDPGSALRPVRAAPYLLHSNRDYNQFSAGQWVP